MLLPCSSVSNSKLYLLDMFSPLYICLCLIFSSIAFYGCFTFILKLYPAYSQDQVEKIKEEDKQS